MISQMAGFVAYYGVVSENNVVTTISLFSDQAGEEESTRRAADWSSKTSPVY